MGCYDFQPPQSVSVSHKTKCFPITASFTFVCLENRRLFPELYESYIGSPRAGRYRDQIPVGVRFLAPLQTGPGGHTASLTKGIGSLSRA